MMELPVCECRPRWPSLGTAFHPADVPAAASASLLRRPFLRATRTAKPAARAWPGAGRVVSHLLSRERKQRPVCALRARTASQRRRSCVPRAPPLLRPAGVGRPSTAVLCPLGRPRPSAPRARLRHATAATPQLAGAAAVGRARRSNPSATARVQPPQPQRLQHENITASSPPTPPAAVVVSDPPRPRSPAPPVLSSGTSGGPRHVSPPSARPAPALPRPASPLRLFLADARAISPPAPARPRRPPERRRFLRTHPAR